MATSGLSAGGQPLLDRPVVLVVWSVLIRIIGTGNANNRFSQESGLEDIYAPTALNGELAFGAAVNGPMYTAGLAGNSYSAHDNQRSAFATRESQTLYNVTLDR